MGWLFGWADRAELVAHLRRPDRFVPGVLLVRSSLVGNHHWYLYRMVDEWHVTVGLDLLAGDVRTRDGWGYKSLSETRGPFELDCPLSFLDPPGPDCEESRAWRARVREYHHQRKCRVRPSKGMVVRYGDSTYQLVESLGHRGWLVDKLPEQVRFRMNGRQLAKALRNPTPNVAATPPADSAAATQTANAADFFLQAVQPGLFD